MTSSENLIERDRPTSATPLVTIGIPCFNAAAWLRECIQSALDQSWPSVEVIVIDDGSTDGSAEIIRSFGSRVRGFFEKHRGGNFARNQIIREARGEWIQFLDGDDYLLPEKIRTQIAEAGTLADWDVLAAPVWREDYAADRQRSLLPDPATNPQDPCRQVLFASGLQTNGGLWRKSALERIGCWDESVRLAQDTEIYCRALRSGLRVKWTPTANAVYRYRWSTTSVCSRRLDRNIQAKFGLFLQMLSWMRKQGTMTSEIERDSAWTCFRLLRELAEMDFPAALQWHGRLRRAKLWHAGDIAERRWAPARYATVYRWFGFGAAEWIARRRVSAQAVA